MTQQPEPILSFVRRKLSEARGQWGEISKSSGVPYHTLTKIAQGQTDAPRIDTVQRLVDYFNGQIVVPAFSTTLPSGAGNEPERVSAAEGA